MPRMIWQSAWQSSRGLYQNRVARHPAWVLKLTGMVAAIVLLPALLLAVVGLLVILVVFTLLSAIGSLFSPAAGPRPDTPQPPLRENVRVREPQ